MFQSLRLAAVISITVAASACGTAGTPVAQDNRTSQGTAITTSNEGATVATSNEGPTMAGDQAPNAKFASLDEFLLHLRETQAPVDGSWYEEVSPGVYQLRTGNLRVLTPEGEAKASPQTFTRAQLMEKYGFTK